MLLLCYFMFLKLFCLKYCKQSNWAAWLSISLFYSVVITDLRLLIVLMMRINDILRCAIFFGLIQLYLTSMQNKSKDNRQHTFEINGIDDDQHCTSQNIFGDNFVDLSTRYL